MFSNKSAGQNIFGNNIPVFRFIKLVWNKSYLTLIIILLVIVSTIISPYFMTKQNIVDLLASNVTISLLALAMFFVIVTGGIDLSVASVVALSGVILAGMLEKNVVWSLAIIITLVLSIVPGLINGLAAGYARIPPFIATLSMMTIARGAAYIFQVGSPRVIDFDQDIVLAIGNTVVLNGWLPINFMILLGALFISWFVLNYMPFGRRLYAIGDNIEAAHLNGIPVSRYLLYTYMISSFLSGAAGIILASRLMLGSALVGSGYELDAIASVIIGGASFAGGSGNAINTVLGAFTFGLIGNILNLLGVGGYPQMIIKGAIIVFALLAVRKKD